MSEKEYADLVVMAEDASQTVADYMVQDLGWNRKEAEDYLGKYKSAAIAKMEDSSPYFEGNTEKDYYTHMKSLELELVSLRARNRELESWTDEAETTIALLHAENESLRNG